MYSRDRVGHSGSRSNRASLSGLLARIELPYNTGPGTLVRKGVTRHGSGHEDGCAVCKSALRAREGAKPGRARRPRARRGGSRVRGRPAAERLLRPPVDSGDRKTIAGDGGRPAIPPPQAHHRLPGARSRPRPCRSSRRDRREISEAPGRGRRGVDYTVDEAGNSLVDGSRTIPRDVEEFWTFARPAGLNFWMLSAIQTS
jgi:hypothetical protein